MLTQLKSIVQELSQIPSLDKALACVAKRLIEVLKVDCCAIYLANYDANYFTLTATEGLSKDAIGKVNIDFSEGLIGLVGQREEPLNIENAPAHPRFKHFPEVNEDSYHAFLGAPIIHQRKVIGVVSLQQQESRCFSEDEEAFLVTLATQMALEIVHAGTRENLLPSEASQVNALVQQSIKGVAGSSGLAVGAGFVHDMGAQISSHVIKRTTQPVREISLFRKAVAATREEVEALSQKMKGQVPEDVLAIFQLYHHLLDANSLGSEVEHKILQGWDGASALKMVVERYVSQFKNMNDPYMQERAADVEDLGNRLLSRLLKTARKSSTIPDDIILVAEEVTASMLAEYPRGKLKGIISIRGSSHSHAAILARGMGLPAVMGLSGISPPMLNQKTLLIDGYSGEIIVSPSQSAIAEFQILIDEEKELSSQIDTQSEQPAVSKDGCEMQLLINLGLSGELELIQSNLGCGVGLFRTEMPFMVGERFPTEKEQVKLYSKVFERFTDDIVVMRTLDVGGDKPLPYFPISEENPFLGWRGIRFTLDHPEIFLMQVRAMMRASIGREQWHIMLPMVSNLSEIEDAQRLLRQAFYEVKEEVRQADLVFNYPKVGVMVEVPGLVYQLEQIAPKVDFLSVGSNDLTQYLLAVDRNNERVSALHNSYHPSVLAVLQKIVDDATRLNIPVGVCGEFAGEAGGSILLMAMGYRHLSMNSYNLRKVNWVIRSVTLAQAHTLLDEALACNHPLQVKEKVNTLLENLGLGGLIRAGK